MNQLSVALPRSVRVCSTGMLFAALLLTGCTSTENDPTMTHIEARNELDAALTAAQHSIGGEWEIADSGAEACTLPSGTSGARYVMARFGGGLTKDQQQPVVEAIVAAWTEAAFRPTVSTRIESDVEVTEINHPATGLGDDGVFVEVNMSETRSSALGQTRCVSGSPVEINRDGRTPTPTTGPSGMAN
jgi:hypothetical protein